MKFNLSKFLAVVSQIGPVILTATPGGERFAPIVGEVVGAIGEAQQIKGATGAEKKAHVLAIAKAAVNTANATGKVKIDAEAVDAVVGTGIDNVIATAKIIEGSKVAVDHGAAVAGAGVEHGGIAGAAGSVPGVDTAPSSSDLGGGHSTHGHGSADGEEKK